MSPTSVQQFSIMKVDESDGSEMGSKLRMSAKKNPSLGNINVNANANERENPSIYKLGQQI